MKSVKSHISKAPVYNPYDKFTKQDFDAWIDDISGALSKALRHEEEERASNTEEKWYYKLDEEKESQIDSQDSSDEELTDDSLAEIRARRVKGKARDPREGPGLALGTFNEPIELESDEEESQSSEEDGGFGGEAGEYEEQSTPLSRRDYGSEEEYDEEEQAGEDFISREVSLEEEDARETRSIDIQEIDEEQMSQNTAFPLDVEDEEMPLNQHLTIRDLWEGPKTFAEDYYSGGDIQHTSVFPVSADVLNAFDENDASDFGFDMSRPNEGNIISSEERAQKADDDFGDLQYGDDNDANGEAQEEPIYSPLPGSSPLPLSPEPEHEKPEQPTPVYILSDDEEEEEDNPVENDQRSSPSCGYNEVDDDDELDADDTVLPLGTSDLGIMEEDLLEVDELEGDRPEVEHVSEDSDTSPLDQPLVELSHQLETDQTLEELPKAHSLLESIEAPLVNDSAGAVEAVTEMESAPDEDQTEHMDEDKPEDIMARSTSLVANIGSTALALEPAALQDDEEETDVYSVIEILSEDDGGVGDEDFDVESVVGTDTVMNHYEVEEMMTEGRLTAELDAAFQSNLGIDLLEESESNQPDVGLSAQDILDIFDGTFGRGVLDEDTVEGQSVSIVVDNEPAISAPSEAQVLLEELVPLGHLPSPPTHQTPIQLVEETSVAPLGTSTDIEAISVTVTDLPDEIEMSAETNPIVAGDAAVDALPSSLPSESLPVEGIIREETIDAVVENVVDDTPDDAPAAQPHHEAVPTQSMPFTETPLHDPFSFAQIRPIPGLLSIPVVSDFSNQPEFLSMEPLTRTTIPVLNDDPYPASLSTPFDDIEDDGSPGDEADDDGDESNSSLESLTMNHEVLSVEAVGDGSQGVVNDEDFWELDLAYPEDTVAPLLDTAHTVPAEDDADGDMDPDFLSTIGGTLTSTLSRDADVDKISPKHVEHQETVVSTSLSSAALTDSEPCPSTPLQSEENTIGVNNVEDMKMEPPLEMPPQTSELPGTGDLVRAIEVSETNGVQNADTKTEPETTQTSEIYSADGAETLEHQPAAPMIDAEKSLIGRVSEHTTEENIQPHEAIHNNNGTVTVDAESLQNLLSADTDIPKASTSKKAEGSQTRRSKRKRKTPITFQSGFSISDPVEQEKAIKAVRKQSATKGKQKEVEISDTASTSDASVAARMLTGSRASSVVSTSTGDGFAQTGPSPIRFSAHHPTPPPPPPVPPLPQLMFHNHGRKPRPALTVQTQVQKVVSRIPSFPQHNAGSASQPNAASQQHSPTTAQSDSGPNTPTPTQSPHVPRREPSTNSPVTRSHCRYHKISLQEEDDSGDHIFFLVPGCSLVDRKLIKEEGIVDHGDATIEDSQRKVVDIETLGINDYVIGVIRMLVGPDKEHDVYFMPRPGEERARTVVHRKSHLSRSSINAASFSVHPTSPRASHASINAFDFSPSSSTMAPPSVAGSSSTNRSSNQRRRQQQKDIEEDESQSEGSISSDEDEEGSLVHKKMKLSPSLEGTEPSKDLLESQQPESVSAGPGPHTKVHTKPKRKRPLDNSAAEYTPAADEEARVSSDDESTKRKPKKKRARASEAHLSTTSVSEEPKRKRKKSTKSIPYGL